MKKLFLFLSTLYYSIHSVALEWSVVEYIDNCSVVHQKMIESSDMETVGYCMGVLKGTLSGILATNFQESGNLNSISCILSNGNDSFWEIQKNVLATMRLDSKEMASRNEPNTANMLVALSLIKLYPCLIKN